RGSDRKPECRVIIDPGPPVLLRQVKVQLAGEHIPEELQLLVSESAPRRDEILHHGRYESFKTLLLQRAVSLGYFQAAWQVQRVQLDPELNRADIELTLALGPRHRFGEIAVTGDGIS